MATSTLELHLTLGKPVQLDEHTYAAPLYIATGRSIPEEATSFAVYDVTTGQAVIKNAAWVENYLDDLAIAKIVEKRAGQTGTPISIEDLAASIGVQLGSTVVSTLKSAL